MHNKSVAAKSHYAFKSNFWGSPQVAAPFFYIGKMMGAKLVYIEVFDRIDKPTMTGKMVYPIVDKFVVQWEEQKKVYPKAVNLGSIF